MLAKAVSFWNYQDCFLCYSFSFFQTFNFSNILFPRFNLNLLMSSVGVYDLVGLFIGDVLSLAFGVYPNISCIDVIFTFPRPHGSIKSNHFKSLL